MSSSSILLDPTVVGEEHYRIAEEVREDDRALQGTAGHHFASWNRGTERPAIASIVTRARRLQRFLTQPFAVTEAFTGKAGRSVPLMETLKGCRTILDGTCDQWAESSLYMVGTIDEAREKEVSSKREAKSP